MSSDPLKLVKFVCAAKAHADGRSASALTIHERAWAFCPMGADGVGHDWRPSDGLPLIDARRFTPRHEAADTARRAPARSLAQGSTAANGRPRAR